MKLSLKSKNQIESDYLRLDLNQLRRITPAKRVYRSIRYEFRKRLIPEGWECGYYNPEDTTEILAMGQGATEQEALALCLAYLEMMRQESPL